MRAGDHRWLAWGALCILLAAGLTGCWDQRPVETRAAVTAIGIDPGKHPGLYRFTFVFPNVTTTTTSIATTPATQEFFHYTVSAANLADAFSAIQRRQSRVLYLGQIRLLALSTRVPSEVWRRFLQTAVQSGPMVLTFVVVGTSNAQSLVALVPPSEVVPELALYRTLTCDCQPFLVASRAWHVWVQMETPGITPIVPQVMVHEDNYVLRGIDLLAPGRPVTWPLADTWGWAYATGHVHEGTVTVNERGEPVTVGRILGHQDLSFHVLDGRIVLNDHLRYTGQLVAGGDALGNPITTDRTIERAVASRLLTMAQQAVKRAQASGTDPFGWHRDLHWTDASAASPGLSWRRWQVRLTVQFLLQNEGVLR